MIALLQRVVSAYVEVGGERVGAIGQGLLVLLGVASHDEENDAVRLADRIVGYRVFGDAGGRMNLSVADAGGELLVVPQFTLAADTKSGTRPSFAPAAPPEKAKRLFDLLVSCLRRTPVPVQCGTFGADMKVGLINDGPVTFWLES